MSTENASIQLNPHTPSSVVVESNELQEQSDQVERIEPAVASHGTSQNAEEEEFQIKKRKKTSDVWDDFEVVMVKGVNKAMCTFCSRHFALIKSGTTTSYKRHLKNCVQRKLKLKKSRL
ncbi:unnamed protein product [Cuscuta epithymum]|uniref:BED-type domain-containing protein n=1 Tax=Cuscuta epithymum TaxID=186058 RepID=A0AAV0BW14_9ASTE|nr:unnamed protein product [Cuscuta epithymum]